MAITRITKIQQFVEGFSNKRFHVGIDVHKKDYHIALRHVRGEVETWVSPADPDRVAHQLLSLGACIESIVYESGPTGFGLARTLIANNLKVIVAAPSMIPRPVTRGAKTDQLDCRNLAIFASKDMISGIAIPTKEQEAERGLFRHRSKLTQSIIKVKQRIKSFLLARTIKEPQGLTHWNKSAVEALAELELESADRLTLDSMVRQLTFLQEERRLADEHLANIAAQNHHCEVMQCLQSVPGVGPVVASAFRLELFDPDRFKSADQVGAYCALAPIVRQSGASKGLSSILKNRQKSFRSLLVQATWRWIAQDEGAKKKYAKLRRQTGLPQKAVVAMARKLAIIMWRLSIEKRPYKPMA